MERGENKHTKQTRGKGIAGAGGELNRLLRTDAASEKRKCDNSVHRADFIVAPPARELQDQRKRDRFVRGGSTAAVAITWPLSACD